MKDNPLSTRPRSILFLCTANICRSPAAAALFTRRRPRDCGRIVRSAGTDGTDGKPITAMVQQVVHKRGIDLSHHQARIATPHLLPAFDLILGMENKHLEWIEQYVPATRERAWLLGYWRGLEIKPPRNGLLSEYERVVDEIGECLTDWTHRIWELDDCTDEPIRDGER